MTVNVNDLLSYWRRAVETTTPVAFLSPENIGYTAYLNLPSYSSAARWLGGYGDGKTPMRDEVAFYLTLNFDGTTTRVERPVTVTTRVWTEKPPNDETLIQLLHSSGAIWESVGTVFQFPSEDHVAYCLNTDLLTAPPASVVLLDEDDCYAWDRADGMTPIDQRDFLNARLRAKRPAPVVVTEQQAKAAVIAAQHEQVVSPLNTSYFELLAASLTRQLAGEQP